MIWQPHTPPLIIWHKNTPEDWTAPAKYVHCKVIGEKIAEDGTRQGRSLIKLECPEAIVYLDTKSKKLVWEHEW